MTTIVFALVHYRNASGIRASIARLQALRLPEGWRSEVIVADNSGDAPEDLGAEIVRTEGNLGYLGGAAVALESWRARHHNAAPGWFVIANPDAELRADSLLSLGSVPLEKDVAVVAPSILLGGTIPQNPFLTRRPSRLRMRFYTIAFRSSVLTRALDVFLELKRLLARRSVRVRSGSRTIYAAHGSITFIRALFFEQGGTLNYRGFMFGEEIHLAEQVRALGLRVLFVTDIEVFHEGASTTGRIDSSRRREWHLASAEVLWKDYFR